MKTSKCTCVLHMNISQYNDLVPIDVTDSARVNALTLHKTDCWPPESGVNLSKNFKQKIERETVLCVSL